MNMAWKEMKRNKGRFLILGSIVFLVSFLTFMISGLANGLSEDNAGLIKDLPEGHFYMTKEANKTYNLSRIDNNTQNDIFAKNSNTFALSIQMGFLNNHDGKQQSVAFVTSTQSKWFQHVKKGEVIFDRSVEDNGIKIGDTLTNKQSGGKLVVKGFVHHSKYSHVPVAYINMDDYKEMFRTSDMQLMYIPGEDKAPTFTGLQAFSKDQFLNTIASYKAEQMSLNMIIWFLIVISGMLFAIFFYMMNVQKMGLYGILKAIGVKTSSLFRMMWTQMAVITVIALILSIALSEVFNHMAPKGVPFQFTFEITFQLSVVFLIIGFIGSTLSGLQIKKVQPLQAIQQGEM
ncbi:ABC transporter permease [Neobacillus fumarioli]|uniref:ABC transporter permease n=1 Tax=Neobacillus fumarioli TaxID=105229 RepID=UPI00082BC018|nr:ABC transporter permease [Neobacillus fumarioli]